MTDINTGREPMDEQRLAEQLKKTGNLMELASDPEWLAEASDYDGPVEAGVMTQPYYNYLNSLAPEQHRSLRFQAQLLSILLPELKQWIESWGLGGRGIRAFNQFILQLEKCSMGACNS